MIPVRDENPTLDLAAATFSIIGINAATWLLLQGLGQEPQLSRSICELGAIPGNLLGSVVPGTRIPLGGGAGCLLDISPQWLTALSSMFLHASWFHLLGNLWFLYVFGDNVEDAMGNLRFAVFYLLCGLAAVGAQVLSDPASTAPLVGASGAIGGVMGAYAVLYPRARVHVLIVLGFYVNRVVVPAYAMLGYWFAMQLLGAALASGQGGVAFWAHVGGFAAGFALLPLFRNPARVEAHRRAMAARGPR